MRELNAPLRSISTVYAVPWQWKPRNIPAADAFSLPVGHCAQTEGVIHGRADHRYVRRS